MAGWAGPQPGLKVERDHKRSVNAMLPAACRYKLPEVTAYDTEERRAEIPLGIMPPALAGILDERTEAGHPVRPWPGLDSNLESGPSDLSGRTL